MRTSPLAAGLVAGLALGLGGVVAADVVTESADAQGGGGFITKSEFQRVEQNSSAAQRIAKTLQNNVGKFFTESDSLIGAKRPPGVIRQARGTGAGGLPSETIQNGAIVRDKIADGSVETSKITLEAITNDRLAPEAVSATKIAERAVGPGKVDTPLAATLAGGDPSRSPPAFLRSCPSSDSTGRTTRSTTVASRIRQRGALGLREPASTRSAPSSASRPMRGARVWSSSRRTVQTGRTDGPWLGLPRQAGVGPRRRSP